MDSCFSRNAFYCSGCLGGGRHRRGGAQGVAHRLLGGDEAGGGLIDLRHLRQRRLPDEIEAALNEHPAVLSAAVIGLPDDDLGNRVHAIVQTDPDAIEVAI